MTLKVDGENGQATYEIRHAAVDEGLLGKPEEFEDSKFIVTTGNIDCKSRWRGRLRKSYSQNIENWILNHKPKTFLGGK